MRRMKIEERLAHAEKRFIEKVKVLKQKGKWTLDQEKKALEKGKKTK